MAPNTTEAPYYLDRIQQLQMQSRTTLLVELSHLRDYDVTLANTIIGDFRRFVFCRSSRGFMSLSTFPSPHQPVATLLPPLPTASPTILPSRYASYLNKALQKCVEKFSPNYMYVNNSNDLREFWVAFLSLENARK